MYKSRGNSFFYDDWSFIEQRRDGLQWLLRPYNDHLIVLQGGLYQVLFHTVGLSRFWVYQLAEIVAHLAVVAIVFEYARRRIGPAAILLALPLLVLGYGWQYVLLPVNVSLLASFLTGVGALLSLDRRDRRGNVAACLLLSGG